MHHSDADSENNGKHRTENIEHLRVGTGGNGHGQAEKGSPPRAPHAHPRCFLETLTGGRTRVYNTTLSLG